MKKRALVIDDDADVRRAVARILERAGWVATQVGDASEGARIQDNTPHELVLLDLSLPDASGLEVLPGLLSLDGDFCIMILTGDDRLLTAVEAMRLGAENFLTKPVDAEHLRVAAERAFEKVRLRQQVRLARLERLRHRSLDPDKDLSAEWAQPIARYAGGDSTILLTGETGVGKGWTAAAIHEMSPRSDAPLLDVNCGALSPNLLESELFGHEAGAFTGAQKRKRGLLELADGGTLLLDEVDSLTPPLQPKLLKVLETKRFRRVGGTDEIQVDIRIIAATNRALEEAIAEGEFRRDLYYRLAVAPIHIPPLRERDPEDVSRIARKVLAEACLEMGKSDARFTDGAEQLILRYSWPGNIRELRNVLSRTLLLHPEVEEIRPEHLPAELGQDVLPNTTPSAGQLATLEELEREHISRVLQHHDGNRTRTAETLGISRAGLYKKLDRLELSQRD